MIPKCLFKQPGIFLYDLKSICWLGTIAQIFFDLTPKVVDLC